MLSNERDDFSCEQCGLQFRILESNASELCITHVNHQALVKNVTALSERNTSAPVGFVLNTDAMILASCFCIKGIRQTFFVNC